MNDDDGKPRIGIERTMIKAERGGASRKDYHNNSIFNEAASTHDLNDTKLSLLFPKRHVLLFGGRKRVAFRGLLTTYLDRRL